MAITIQQSPSLVAPAFNELFFLLTTTNSGQPNFKFICYVKNSSGTVIAKVKKPCEPSTTKAFFDVGRIIEQYVSYDFSLASPTIQACANSYTTFTCEFAEEYGTTPAEQTVSATSSTHYIWNAALPAREMANYSSETYLIAPLIYGRFLTESTIPTTLNTKGFIYCLHDLGNYSNTIVVTAKNSAGTTIQTSTITYTPSPLNYTTRMQRLPSHPITLNSLANGSISKTSSGLDIIPSTTAMYTISWGAATMTFKVQTASCNNSISVYWLNKYGGFDSFVFDGRNLKSHDITKKTYTKERAFISGSSVDIATSNAGSVQHYTSIQDKIKLNSGRWLMDYESTYLQSLFTSPVVFAEISGSLYRVNVLNNSFEEKLNNFDDLVSYEFDIQFSIDNRSQRL